MSRKGTSEQQNETAPKQDDKRNEQTGRTDNTTGGTTHENETA